MEGELAEFVPAREVMCGGCCGGVVQQQLSNDNQNFFNDSGAGNGENGFANGPGAER